MRGNNTGDFIDGLNIGDGAVGAVSNGNEQRDDEGLEQPVPLEGVPFEGDESFETADQGDDIVRDDEVTGGRARSKTMAALDDYASDRDEQEEASLTEEEGQSDEGDSSEEVAVDDVGKYGFDTVLTPKKDEKTKEAEPAPSEGLVAGEGDISSGVNGQAGSRDIVNIVAGVEMADNVITPFSIDIPREDDNNLPHTVTPANTPESASILNSEVRRANGAITEPQEVERVATDGATTDENEGRDMPIVNGFFISTPIRWFMDAVGDIVNSMAAFGSMVVGGATQLLTEVDNIMQRMNGWRDDDNDNEDDTSSTDGQDLLINHDVDGLAVIFQWNDPIIGGDYGYHIE